MNTNLINSLVLAYIGDSVFETHIRDYYINKGLNKVNDLQKEVTKWVSAIGQEKIMDYFLGNNILTDKEIEIFKKGRNTKVNSSPKNTSLSTYKKATGFEAMLGYLYYEDKERLKIILEQIEVVISC